MNQQKEIKEAIQAVQTTLSYLKESKGYLDSARGWGIYDLFGGGFISTMIKHGKMGNAQSAIEAAKNSLPSLRKELNDVNTIIDIDLQLNDFIHFADWFFDGFVADYLVQSRINTARKQVNEAIEILENILSQLKSYQY